jgi:hypothetical protein
MNCASHGSASAKITSTRQTRSGVNASTRNNLQLSASRLLPWNNYFYSGIGNFLQSSEQGITLESALGGGIGRYVKNTNQASISVLGGFAWEGRDYKPSIVPQGTQNLAAAMIAADVKLFRFNKTNLSVTATFVSGHLRTRSCSFQYERDLRCEDLQQSVVECFVLRQLGQAAASQLLRQRLWFQLGAELDIWH